MHRFLRKKMKAIIAAPWAPLPPRPESPSSRIVSAPRADEMDRDRDELREDVTVLVGSTSGKLCVSSRGDFLRVLTRDSDGRVIRRNVAAFVRDGLSSQLRIELPLGCNCLRYAHVRFRVVAGHEESARWVTLHQYRKLFFGRARLDARELREADSLESCHPDPTKDFSSGAPDDPDPAPGAPQYRLVVAREAYAYALRMWAARRDLAVAKRKRKREEMLRLQVDAVRRGLESQRRGRLASLPGELRVDARGSRHGHGVFAEREYREGEPIVACTGTIVVCSRADVREYDETMCYAMDGAGELFSDLNIDTVDAAGGNLVSLINSAYVGGDPAGAAALERNQNVELCFHPEPLLVVYALRDIRRGEELLADYAYPTAP